MLLPLSVGLVGLIFLFDVSGAAAPLLLREGDISPFWMWLGHSLLLALALLPAVYFFTVAPLRRHSERVRQQQQAHAFILSNIPDLVWTKDANSRYTMVNPAMEKATGLSAQEIIGRTDEDIWTTAEASGCRSDDEQAREAKQPLVAQKTLTGRDGRPITYYTTRVPLFDAVGTFTGTLGIARDVTGFLEQERAERRQTFLDFFSQACASAGDLPSLQATLVRGLTETLEVTRSQLWLRSGPGSQLRCVIQAPPEPPHPALAIDPDGQSVYLETLRSANRALAYDDVETAPALRDLLPDFLRPAAIRAKLDVPIAGQATHGFISVEQAGSPRHWIEDEIRCVALAGDLYASAANRIANAQARAHNETILSTALDAIIAIDERGIIESFNGAAERIFGYAANEVIGQNVSLLMTSPHQGKHDDYLAHYLTTGEKRIIGIGREVPGKRKDGSIVPLALSVSEFTFGGRRGFTGVLRDLSERHRMEAALAEMKELAELDALTGLPNRRTLITQLNYLVSAAVSEGQTLCAAIIDVDHFKSVNDRYGHAAGDEVLRRFGRALRATLRAADFAGRLGGEEFLVLMPNTTADNARALLFRLRQAITALAIKTGPGESLTVTFSAGLDVLYATDTAESLLERIDRLLYRAKRGGRDRIAVA